MQQLLRIKGYRMHKRSLVGVLWALNLLVAPVVNESQLFLGHVVCPCPPSFITDTHRANTAAVITIEWHLKFKQCLWGMGVFPTDTLRLEKIEWFPGKRNPTIVQSRYKKTYSEVCFISNTPFQRIRPVMSTFGVKDRREESFSFLFFQFKRSN